MLLRSLIEVAHALREAEATEDTGIVNATAITIRVPSPSVAGRIERDLKSAVAAFDLSGPAVDFSALRKGKFVLYGIPVNIVVG